MSKKQEEAGEPPIDRRIKVLSMGAAASGKSCLIKRYCEGKFVTRYISTIGVDFGVKPVTIKGKTVKVNFWDLSGQPEFFEIRNEFYKNTQGALMVFDVTSRASFDALDGWLEESQKFGLQTEQIVLCANKVDKPKRVITEEEGRAWAEGHGIEYFETSANSGQNVQDMFMHLFVSVYQKYWPTKKRGRKKRRA